jgi:hypothetical protein
MALLFVLVRAAAAAYFPDPLAGHDGAFDDLGAVLEGLQDRVPPLAFLLAPLRAIAGWLASGRRRGRLVFTVAAAMGAALVLVETSIEGLSPVRQRAMLVVTVIVFIEGAGVALGYALLGDWLGLFRSDKPS